MKINCKEAADQPGVPRPGRGVAALGLRLGGTIPKVGNGLGALRGSDSKDQADRVS